MLKITIENDDGADVLDLSAEEQKAFEFVALSPSDWIRNAIYNRVRQAVDEIVADNSDKNPGKASIADKVAIVKGADIKSVKERDAEMVAEIER